MNSWKRKNSTSQSEAIRQTFLDENGTGVVFIQNALGIERKKSEDLTTQLAKEKSQKESIDVALLASEQANGKLKETLSKSESELSDLRESNEQMITERNSLVQSLETRQVETEQNLENERERKRELEQKMYEMQQTIEDSASLRDTIQNSCNTLSVEKSKIWNELRQCKEELEETHLTVQSIQDEKDDAVAEKNSMEVVLTSYEQSSADMERQLTEAEEQISRIQSEYESVNIKNDKINVQIESIIDNHETAIKEKNDAIISMTTKANQKVASLEATAKESKELSAERLKMELLEKQNAQRCNKFLRQEIEELKENTKQLEQTITTNSKELEQVVLEKKEASVGLNNAQRSNEYLRQEIEERKEDTKQLEETITTNSKKLEQVTSEKKKVSVDLKNALVSNKALQRESEELEEKTKQLEERITTSSKELQKVELEKKEASVGLENAQRSNESFQRKIEALTEQLEQTITASSKKLQQVVLEKKAASAGLENAQRSNESLQKEIKELRNDKKLQLIVIADLKKIQAQDNVKRDALSARLYNETEEHRKTAMNFANVYGQNEIAKKERNDLSAKVNLIESKNEKLLNNLTEISSQKDVIEQAQTKLKREYDGMKSLLECTQIANQDLKSEISKLEGQAAQLKDEIKKEAEGKNKAENSVKKYTVAYDTLLQQHEDCKQQLVDLTEANDKLSKQVLDKMTIKEYIEKHGNFPSSSHNTTGPFCPDDDPVGPFLSDTIGNGTFGDNDILKRQQECVQCINDQKCALNSKEKAKKRGHCITCKKGRYFDKDALTCCDGKYTRHQEMMKLGQGKKKRGASASAETASKNKKKQKKGLKTSGLFEEEKAKNNDENNTDNGRKSSPRIKFTLSRSSNAKRRSPKLPLKKNNKTSKHPAVVLCCAGELCQQILGKTITGRSHPCIICKGRMHGNICSDGTVEDPNRMTCKMCASRLG